VSNADVFASAGVSSATVYAWNASFDERDVSAAAKDVRPQMVDASVQPDGENLPPAKRRAAGQVCSMHSASELVHQP
jgi:hypothetical protein